MLESDLNAAGAVLFPFLRALAHDMAAPLTSVLGYAQLNQEAPGPEEELLEDLGLIEEAAQSLRRQVSLLSRLSRYLPAETSCPADTLLQDLQLLTRSLSQTGGNSLQWHQPPDTSEDEVRGNPWLLRATCLALLGALCRCPASQVLISWTDPALVLQFTAPDEQPANASPEGWGCPSLGQRLARAQALSLEKGDSWKLTLPFCKKQ
ncbi:MAG: histidine kinase dimerization/phospho-acceptor domain-containing protein [Vulcanimicrobiota bacterium]